MLSHEELLEYDPAFLARFLLTKVKYRLYINIVKFF